MEKMKLNEIGKKIAKLLYDYNYNGKISFDWKSYDDAEDIPHLMIGINRYNVDTFKISKDGNEITIISLKDNKPYEYTFYLNYNMYFVGSVGHSEEDYEKHLEDMNVYELLQDVYYETNESYEFGDFESDFLSSGIKPYVFMSIPLQLGYLISEMFSMSKYCLMDEVKMSEVNYPYTNMQSAEDDDADTDLYFCYLELPKCPNVRIARYNVEVDNETDAIMSVDTYDVDIEINGKLYDAVNLHEIEKINKIVAIYE